MDVNIGWTLFLEVAARKVQRTVDTVAERAGCAMLVEQVERYEKGPTKIKVMAVSARTAPDRAHAVYETLRMAQRIGLHWEIIGPEEDDSGYWRLEGWTQPASVLGVTALKFLLEPADIPRREFVVSDSD